MNLIIGKWKSHIHLVILLFILKKILEKYQCLVSYIPSSLLQWNNLLSVAVKSVHCMWTLCDYFS